MLVEEPNYIASEFTYIVLVAKKQHK